LSSRSASSLRETLSQKKKKAKIQTSISPSTFSQPHTTVLLVESDRAVYLLPSLLLPGKADSHTWQRATQEMNQNAWLCLWPGTHPFPFSHPLVIEKHNTRQVLLSQGTCQNRHLRSITTLKERLKTSRHTCHLRQNY
jgi:hypothetical protein